MSAIDALKSDVSPKGPVNSHGALVAEMVACGGLVTLDSLSAGSSPAPRDFIGLFVAFEVLAVMADVGPSTARVAAGLGALVTFAVAMFHTAGILRFTGWLTGGAPTAPMQPPGVGDAPPDYQAATGIPARPGRPANYRRPA